MPQPRRGSRPTRTVGTLQHRTPARLALTTGALLLFGALALAPRAQADDGLSVAADLYLGPRWATRLAVAPTTRLPQLRLMGDYYLLGGQPDARQDGSSGGLRLTSGLFVGAQGAMYSPSSGLRLPISADTGASAWPYLGLGYSAASLRGGWGFSADLGLAAEQPGALRLGRMLSRDLDEQLRDLRLRPVLQLGVSFTF